jgi:hypothetical protein
VAETVAMLHSGGNNGEDQVSELFSWRNARADMWRHHEKALLARTFCVRSVSPQ